jgi:tetratricopeptide (TPR) repeat protein
MTLNKAAAGLAVMVLCLVMALPAMAADSAALVKQADELFTQRADLAKAKQAADLYEKALAADPRNEEAAWKAARVIYWIGRNTEGDDAKVKVFERGIANAKKAVAINPKSLGGHYWLGVSYGLYGSAKGVSKSLALINPIKEEMAAVIAQDPKYDEGGPYRVLGRLYFKVPGIFGGSNSDAIENLTTAIKYGPTRWLNHLYLAEVYIDEDENDKAKELLVKVIQGPAPQGLEPEYAMWKANAEELMKEVK